MPVVIVREDWNNQVIYDGVDYYNFSEQSTPSLGYLKETQTVRPVSRFPLTDLPSGQPVKRVRVRFNVATAGGVAHLADIHPYRGNGQPDPSGDDGATIYNGAAQGDPYIDDTDAFRTLGWTPWFDLGSRGCQDVKNAKDAVNRFSLGLHEEGDNDPYASYCGHIPQAPGPPPELEITYGEEGYSYSDGLTSIQVIG